MSPRRSRRPFRALILSAVAIAALGISGCTGGSAGSGSADGSQELSYGITSNVTTGLDPHRTQSSAAANVLRNVFDSLVDVDESGDVVPWLAESWEISEDGLDYTFHLRDDVVFHDGEVFDAQAVVDNFEHVVDPKTESAAALALLGADRYEGGEAIDEHTVVLHLKKPFAPLLANLSNAQLGMYSPKVLEEHRDELSAGGPGITVGSGPFVVEDLVADESITLAPNEDYDWPSSASDHEGATDLTRLTIRILPEPSVLAGALSNGDMQVAGQLPPSSLADLDDDIEVTSHDWPGVPYSLFLNDGHGQLGDERVRQAIKLGVDIDAAVEAIFDGAYDRAWSILTPATPHAYDASLEGSSKYDPDAAGRLLDDAGWTERDEDGYRTKNGERLTLQWIAYTPVSDEKQGLVNAFQQDLKKIGVEVVRENLEPAQYMELYTPRDFDATDWGYDGIDGDVLGNHFDDGGYQNVSTASHPEVVALLEQARETTDEAERERIYREVQQWNDRFVAAIPIYVPKEITAVRPEVDGIEYDAYGRPRFVGASIG